MPVLILKHSSVCLYSYVKPPTDPLCRNKWVSKSETRSLSCFLLINSKKALFFPEVTPLLVIHGLVKPVDLNYSRMVWQRSRYNHRSRQLISHHHHHHHSPVGKQLKWSRPWRLLWTCHTCCCREKTSVKVLKFVLSWTCSFSFNNQDF